MKPPSSFVPALLFALPACHDATPPASAPEGIACPLTERVRLASPPGDFEPGNFFYSLHRLGDHLLFSFERADSDARIFWHTSRCGGPVTEYTSLPAGLLPRFAIATEGDPILYAVDRTGQVFLADRFATPEFDEPRPVAGIPALGPGGSLEIPTLARRYANFSVRNAGHTSSPAAGIGAFTSARYVHSGDPDDPAIELGATIVNVAFFDDHVLVHDDDGTLRRVDPFTGASETLQTGVRYMSASPDGRKLIWQELGDDQTESVYLRDLETGTDLGIAVNDFAQLSWGRDTIDPSDSGAGLWSWTRDSAFVALRGPEGTLVAAVRNDTGEALAIPPHTDSRSPIASHFLLDLGDAAEHVSALWNPAAGDLLEWYRGPSSPSLKLSDATFADFVIPDSPTVREGPLVRVDLATGAVTERLPIFSRSGSYLSGDIYIHAIDNHFVTVPGFDAFELETPSANLSFADAATKLYTPIADDITAMARLPDEGVIVLDAHGENPGVWAVPFPN